MSTLRNLAAVIAGIVTFILVIIFVEWIGHQVYESPAVDFESAEQVRAYMATIPIGAILFVGLAWAAGAFGGTMVGGLIGTLKPLYFGVIVGGLVLAGAITNMMIIPHPWWFAISSLIGIVLAAYAAIRLLEARRRGASRTSAE